MGERTETFEAMEGREAAKITRGEELMRAWAEEDDAPDAVVIDLDERQPVTG